MRTAIVSLVCATLVVVSGPALAGGQGLGRMKPGDGTKPSNCRAEAAATASGVRSSAGAIRKQAFKDCMAR